MKKNRYEVWKQTFSELDFETLRVKSAALGNSLNARHQRPAGRNKPYHSIEDIEMRCPSAYFSVFILPSCCTVAESKPLSTSLRCSTG